MTWGLIVIALVVLVYGLLLLAPLVEKAIPVLMGDDE
jgi:hypothetical protein